MPWALLALATGWVDPVGVWGHRGSPGAAVGYLATAQHWRSHRLHRLASLRPRTLILGSSRSAYALDPSWMPLSDPDEALNASLNSPGIGELVALARMAWDSPNLRTLVVELHPWMFCRIPPFHDRPPEGPRTDLWAQWSDALAHTGSQAAWGRAADTLGHAWRGDAPGFGPQGEDRGFLLRARGQLGQPEENIPFKRHLIGVDMGPPADHARGQVRALVAGCRARGIRLVALFPPTHQLESRAQGRQWSRPEWRGLWRVIQDQTPELWDFNQGNPWRWRQSHPSLGQHFVDSTHASRRLGRWMMARLGLAGPAAVPEGFGRRVEGAQAPAVPPGGGVAPFVPAPSKGWGPD